MNLPQAYARGFSLIEQRCCSPRILRPLVLDVGSDNLFIDTNGWDKVAFRPETVGTKVNLLEELELLFHISWAIGFVESDKVSYWDTGWDGDEHVDMILVMIELFDTEFG